MLILLSLLALQADAAPPAPPAASAVTTASGLRFEMLAPGTGRRPQPGDAVLVTYEGRLADGTLFDAAAQPVGLLVSDAIPGFTEALLLMNEGGRYRFRIPAGSGLWRAGPPGRHPAQCRARLHPHPDPRRPAPPGAELPIEVWPASLAAAQRAGRAGAGRAGAALGGGVRGSSKAAVSIVSSASRAAT